MLNVSATQELHRRLEAQTEQLGKLVRRLTDLEQEREAQAARIADLEQQAAALAMLRQQLADLQATVRAMGEGSAPRVAIGK